MAGNAFVAVFDVGDDRVIQRGGEGGVALIVFHKKMHV